MKTYYLLLLTLLFPLFSFGQFGPHFCEGWSWNLGQPGLSDPAHVMVSDKSTNFRLYVGDAGQYGGMSTINRLGYLDRKYNWNFMGNFRCTSCGTGRVESMVIDDNDNLYIGGFFEGVEDKQGNFVASKNVIRYDPSTETFQALGYGLEADFVKGLVWRNDTLFAAGRISFAKNITGNIPVNNVALYDESTNTWHPMGQGIETHILSTDDNGDVYDLEKGANGDIYAAGRFSKINGQDTVFSVAKWSPSLGWQKMGTGLFLAYDPTRSKYPSIINDLVFDKNNEVLYATGYLGYTNGGPNVLASWDGTQWNYIDGLGKPSSSSSIFAGYTLYFESSPNTLYVGGNFNLAGANPFKKPISNYLAAYSPDSNTWEGLGMGITKASSGAEVSAISRLGSRICVSGNFTEVNHQPVNFIAGFRPGQNDPWVGIGTGAHENCNQINALGHLDLLSKSTIVVGGEFSKIGEIYATGLAAYTTEKGFHTLFGASLKRNGFSLPKVHDIHISKDKEILVAGVFDSLYQLNFVVGTLKTRTFGFGVYNPQLNLWSSPISSRGGGLGEVFTASTYKGQYLIGGDFTSLDGNTAHGLAIKDTSTNTWQELANVGGGNVKEILVVHDSLIYIGGNFSTINGQNIAGAAVYDGTSWSGLGQGFGFQDDVHALAWDSTTQEVAIGGQIEGAKQSDGTWIDSEGIIFWNGSTWSSRGRVSARFTNPAQYAYIVHSIEMGVNGEFFVGGEFSGIDGVNADRIVKYTPGIGWQALQDLGVSHNSCSSGRNPAVKAISHALSENALYLGGTFNASGTVQAGKFARYGLGSNNYVPMIDSVKGGCSGAHIWVDSSFYGLQWSIGGNEHRKYVRNSDMDGMPEKWISVTGIRNGCSFVDSVLIKDGVNIFLPTNPGYAYLVDTNRLTVAMYSTATYSYWDTVSLNFGDGTLDTYSNRLSPLPDTFYHTYAAPGIYTITLLIGNVCAGSRFWDSVNLGITPISDAYSLGFNLYPNPNKGSFKLTYQSPSSGGFVHLELFDMMGRSLWENDVKPHELTVSKEIKIEGLVPGRYLLRLKDGTRWGRKLISIE